MSRRNLSSLFFALIIPALAVGCTSRQPRQKVQEGPFLADAGNKITVSVQNEDPLKVAITNYMDYTVTLFTRAILFEGKQGWERDYHTQYYFRGTQLSSPLVPSIASSITLAPGAGHVCEMTPITSGTRFRLEFVAFPDDSATTEKSMLVTSSIISLRN